MQKINLDQANHTVISKQLLHSVSLSAVSWVILSTDKQEWSS